MGSDQGVHWMLWFTNKSQSCKFCPSLMLSVAIKISILPTWSIPDILWRWLALKARFSR